jgi:hypothetical protein
MTLNNYLFVFSLANKQDKAEALDKNAILEDLKIERLVNENQTLCRVVKIQTEIRINNFFFFQGIMYSEINES